MLEQKQITLTVDADTIKHLRHAVTVVRALGEIMPMALEARLHLRHEARELGLLARMIEREIEGA